jgi:hypothetical protein
MAMTCPTCKNENAARLIAGEGNLGCDSCFVVKPQINTGSLHQVKFNKWGTRMTIADANRIKTNKKRADGKYRPDPRWRTTGD